MKKKTRGFTLLETMLVMAIAASLLLFAINQYEQFKQQASFLAVKENVDMLFQAVGRYYQANCRNISDVAVADLTGKTTHTISGDLAPPTKIGEKTTVDYEKSNVAYPIDITAALVDNHFLTAQWPSPTPITGTDNYTVQLIFLLTPKSAYACWNFKNAAGSVECNTSVYASSSNPPPYGPQPTKSSQIAYWLAQVSVKIDNDPDGTKTRAFLGPTGANCASSSPDTCDSTGTPQYLIWQQLPTKSGSKVASDLWVSQQQEAAFNQQYTHDVLYEMTTRAYAASSSDIDTYYLCGS